MFIYCCREKLCVPDGLIVRQGRIARLSCIICLIENKTTNCQRHFVTNQLAAHVFTIRPFFIPLAGCACRGLAKNRFCHKSTLHDRLTACLINRQTKKVGKW